MTVLAPPAPRITTDLQDMLNECSRLQVESGQLHFKAPDNVGKPRCFATGFELQVPDAETLVVNCLVEPAEGRLLVTIDIQPDNGQILSGPDRVQMQDHLMTSLAGFEPTHVFNRPQGVQFSVPREPKKPSA